MSKFSDKTKATLSALKTTVDTERNNASDIFTKSQNKINSLTDNLSKDLKTTDKFKTQKIDDFKKKLQSKIDNKKDIFEDMLETCQVFLNDDKNKIKNKFNKKNEILTNKKFASNQKIKQYAYESMVITLGSSKEIISNNVRKVFFAGDGVCGANSNLKTDVISISPKEIDFFNIFTLSPDSGIGKVVYETDDTINLIKMNKSLYDTFNGPQFNFNTADNKKLFSVIWDESTQQFFVNGLQQNGLNVNVGDFFSDYYNSIEFPDITNVLKINMFLTINGDGSETVEFTKGLNDLNRLLQKVFSICGPKKNRDELKNQTTANLFDENDGDLDYYFDFENLEGVDLDDEESKLRKVLKFTDCNNFETPIETSMMEDFIFQATKKNINDLIDNTLSMTAQNAYEQSDSNIPKDNFNLSLDVSFIKNLPKSLIASVLSPKIFFPIVLIYKMFKTTSQNAINNAKEIMVKLKKLFLFIIKDVFWKFLSEFWKKIKTELIKFLKLISLSIIKERYDRYVTMLKSLIGLVRNLGNTKIDTCENLFGSIDTTINTILESGYNPPIPLSGPIIPKFLLSLSYKSPGFSKKRALINIVEMLEVNGIDTNPINGVVPNNLVIFIQSFLEGFWKEMDRNSFIRTSNQPAVLPVIGPAGGVVILKPGDVFGAGKTF